MTLLDLQKKLAEAGHYHGDLDGFAGKLTCDAIVAYLTDGPDTLLTDIDFDLAARRLSVPTSYVRALCEVESTGSPFIDGRPTILFEPHIFSRLTGGRYDNSHPHLSSRVWNPKLYPGSQAGRYAQLTEAVCLDVEAGFSAASYGAFQILGSNYKRCDAESALDFALSESQCEANQIHHFCNFITSDPILWQALRRGDWVTVAKRYNGSAYFKNRYDVRLAQAVRKWS